MIVRWLLHALSGRLRVRVITAEVAGRQDEGGPLFERYLLGRPPRLGQRGWSAIYLHHYLRSDPDNSVHDHPWDWGLAIPLAGGYDELRLAGFDADGPRLVTRRRRAGVPYRLTGTDFHRVVLHGPTSWSLFIHGPLTKGWGFLRQARLGNQVVVRFDPPSDWDMDEMRFWDTARRGSEVARAGP